eukprot:TRINITY_DN123130_c0_g1_i1.p1 TRINITY_DN123130_c0_g1~~TRINITY_DN123130_c0_g1_i1.p1  ORF type:complete len:441 (+),score=31.79 TRINITY_DN123130_c0_g1_i1:91-1323(+)
MVVAGRLHWLSLHAQAGSDIKVVLSHNHEKDRSKVTFTVRAQHSRNGQYSPLVLDMLQLLRRYENTQRVTDSGHRHSNGVSTASFWINFGRTPTEAGLRSRDPSTADVRLGDQGMEPENEDDMQDGPNNVNSAAESRGNRSFAGSCGTFLHYTSIQEDTEKMMALSRSFSEPALAKGLRSAIQLDSDWMYAYTEPQAFDYELHQERVAEHRVRLQAFVSETERTIAAIGESTAIGLEQLCHKAARDDAAIQSSLRRLPLLGPQLAPCDDIAADSHKYEDTSLEPLESWRAESGGLWGFDGCFDLLHDNVAFMLTAEDETVTVSEAVVLHLRFNGSRYLVLAHRECPLVYLESLLPSRLNIMMCAIYVDGLDTHTQECEAMREPRVSDVAASSSVELVDTSADLDVASEPY